MEKDDWLKDEIIQSQRCWRRLGDIRASRIAVVWFPVDGEADREALAEEARAVGLTASPSNVVALAAHVPDWLTISIFAYAGVKELYSFIKMVNDGPPQVRQFIDKLRGIRGTREVHPVLLLEPINRWLDAKYGPRNWRYDPEAIEEYERFGGPHLLAVHEEVRGETILFRGTGETVEVLPSEWLPDANSRARLPPPSSPDASNG